MLLDLDALGVAVVCRIAASDHTAPAHIRPKPDTYPPKTRVTPTLHLAIMEGTTLAVTIRTLIPDDYEGYAAVSSAAYQDPVSAERLRMGDQQHRQTDTTTRRQRWVAVADGQIVGMAGYFQRIRAYHPQKFQVELGVLPEYRRRGIGSALYEHLLAGLAEYDPMTLTGRAREDWPESIAFLAHRGCVENVRTWESHLDLATVDPTRFQPWLEHPLAQGYTIDNLSEVQALADWEEQLYDLINEIRRDVPSDEPRTETPFDSFKASLSNRFIWPEGFLVASYHGKMVGVSQLFLGDIAGTLNNGLTGVVREHRGTGIAKALKVRGIQVAREAGYLTIRTWNESNNHRMLAINLQLGFQRQPAWITYKRYLKTPE
jgi:mycothiol synthase